MSEQNPHPTLLDQNQILQRSFNQDLDRLRVDAEAVIVGDDIVLKIESESDNILVLGTEDGTKTGTQHVIRTTTDGTVKVKDDASEISLASIDTKLTNGSQKTQQVDASGNVQPAGDVLTRKIFVQPTDGINNQSYTSASEAKVNISSIKGTISLLNSTTTPLGSNATFTGTYEDISNYASISVLFISDQSSSATGMEMDFSTDGVNTDVIEQYFFDATHANGDMLTLPAKGQFFRIKYTNGTSAQGFFRLETIYRTAPYVPTALVNTQLTDTSEVATSRSIIVGKSTSGGGTYVNVKVNPSGALNTAIGDITGIVGQQTAANSLPVVLASDQIASATSTITRVSASATSVQLLASNTARKGAIFVNDSVSNCYLKFGTTASATSYTFLMTSGSTVILEQLPIYTGRIDAIWVTATGAMEITELT